MADKKAPEKKAGGKTVWAVALLVTVLIPLLVYFFWPEGQVGDGKEAGGSKPAASASEPRVRYQVRTTNRGIVHPLEDVTLSPFSGITLPARKTDGSKTRLHFFSDGTWEERDVETDTVRSTGTFVVDTTTWQGELRGPSGRRVNGLQIEER